MHLQNLASLRKVFFKFRVAEAQAFTGVTLKLSEEGVEEQMGRSGGAAEMLFLIRSTVKCTCTEVQKSVLKLNIQLQIFLTVTAVTTSSTFLPSTMIISHNDHIWQCRVCNLKHLLSLWVPKSPQVATKSPTSSSSDATISDTTITSNKEN